MAFLNLLHKYKSRVNNNSNHTLRRNACNLVMNKPREIYSEASFK